MLNSALPAVLRSALIWPRGASQISVAAAWHRVSVPAMHPKGLQIKAFLIILLQIIPMVESYNLILVVNWFGLGLSAEKYLEQTFFFTPQ